MAIEGAAALSTARQCIRRMHERGRFTKKAEALIAGVYLSGTNTRRVKRALFGLFEGAVSKDVVSRAPVDRRARSRRTGTPGARAALPMKTSSGSFWMARSSRHGATKRPRISRCWPQSTARQAIAEQSAERGVRRDGQKVLLSIRNMGGESTTAWCQFLGDLDARGLKRPEFVIVDGAPGLEAALVALWGEDLPIQRCTVHKHRNLLGHLHRAVRRERDQRAVQQDLSAVIGLAGTRQDIEQRRRPGAALAAKTVGFPPG